MERNTRGASKAETAKVDKNRLAPLPVPAKAEIVKVDSERELLAMARTLKQRIAQDPSYSMLLLANPVLALKAYGFELSPKMADHVLRSLRHPKPMRERREQLERSLQEKLGKPPRPNDPVWMAELVFRHRELPPKETDGLSPAYSAGPFDKAIAALKDRRPGRTSRYSVERRLPGAMTLGVADVRPMSRRLDLTAPVPSVPTVKTPPQSLSLEQAWFYKDDPVVAEAVELGQIERRALPFRTPDEFRRIAEGKQVDVFRAFVREVRVKDRKTRRGPRGSSAE